MPYKPEEREYRAMPIMAAPGEGGQKKFDSENYVEGYATTYNQPYLLGNFDGIDYYEQVDRHALDGADMSDIIMQYDHHGRVLARQSNHTLLVDSSDNHGIFVAADLSKSDAARSIYSDISAGLIQGMSWAFTVAEDSFDVTTNTRTILKIRKVYDVSAVSIPANPATDISARNYCERRAAAVRQEVADLAKRERALAECRALLSL